MTLMRMGVVSVLFFFAFGITVSQSQPLKDVQVDSVHWDTVATGLSFPEGPAWNAMNQTLYVSNCYADWMAAISDTGVDTFVTEHKYPEVFGQTNGLTVYEDGAVYGCEFGLGTIITITQGGEASVYASGYDGEPFRRPNDLAFHPSGDLYFTDPGKYNRDKSEGRVFRIIRESGRVELLADALAFPNGIAVSPEAQFLYVCESIPNRIWRYPLLKGGRLGERTLFAELPGGEPDGIAFDQSGRLYVAHFGGRGVYVLDESGAPVRMIRTPGKNPSNVEFGGADLKTLYVTEDETNAVYSTGIDVPGMPLFSNPARK